MVQRFLAGKSAKSQKVRKQNCKSQNGALFYTSENKETIKELLFARYLQKERVEVFWKNVAHSL